MAALSIPWSASGSVTFEYRGAEVTVSTPRYNKYLNGWAIDLSWEGRVIKGIPLYSGISLLDNFEGTPLPELSVFYKVELTSDPRSLEGLVLYIRET